MSPPDCTTVPDSPVPMENRSYCPPVTAASGYTTSVERNESGRSPTKAEIFCLCSRKMDRLCIDLSLAMALAMAYSGGGPIEAQWPNDSQSPGRPRIFHILVPSMGRLLSRAAIGATLN